MNGLSVTSMISARSKATSLHTPRNTSSSTGMELKLTSPIGLPPAKRRTSKVESTGVPPYGGMVASGCTKSKPSANTGWSRVTERFS